MKFTLRTRLALLYGALVALTTGGFAVVAYYTVSNELYANLDASLVRAGSSLLAVIEREQDEAKQPLAPVKKNRRKESGEDVFAFLQRSSLRDFVGPIPVPDSVIDQPQDPVWTAVYEHVLLNSSTYLLQVRSPSGEVVWRSDNLLTDSLPRLESVLPMGPGSADRMTTWISIRGTSYRLTVVKDARAEVAAAYPVAEVDFMLRRLFSLLLYSIPFLIVVSIGAGWFLARRALRPVDHIAKAARRITAERLSERLPAPVSNDEIGRLTDILNDMIARLERSFEQVRQFTADASHELKTPLAILMGEIEVALRDPKINDDARITLESCLEEVVRLTHVVQGLLDLSRAESGQLQLEHKPVNITSMLDDLCEDIGILAERKSITVTSSIQRGLMVSGDSVRLHQAILNVLENALKYTNPSGSVDVKLYAEFSNVHLKVTDTGIGIEPHLLSKIYDRFYRVDQARSQDIQGTGLGLSIVRWIIEMHGGTITAESTVNVGTTFTITLPRSV
ncbi:MAG: HAMP domain-containing protein [Bradyrhizobiaceae bacterium]|nr:HAMP domain-containing protein [Bradyrhizobiaceae bacterium]